MRFINYLQEEYLNRMNDIEVFVNPTAKELQQISANANSIRFFVRFSEKKLIAWDAEILHHDMITKNQKVQKILGSKNTNEWRRALPDLFSGYGDYSGGKIINMESDGVFVYSDHYEDYKKMDSKWTTRWFRQPLTELIVELIEDMGYDADNQGSSSG